MGSVFSNMLLVLGCCFFFGGINHKEQRFNATSAIANMSLLLLSSLALVLPTPLTHAQVRLYFVDLCEYVLLSPLLIPRKTKRHFCNMLKFSVASRVTHVSLSSDFCVVICFFS